VSPLVQQGAIGDHDDPDAVHGGIGADAAADRVAVHPRQDHVQQDHVRADAGDAFDGLLAGGGGLHVEIRGERLSDMFPDRRGVVHDENTVGSFHGSVSSPFFLKDSGYHTATAFASGFRPGEEPASESGGWVRPGGRFASVAPEGDIE
jgi:hypothetical protein